jgi:5-methylthioribose kinase
MNEEAGGLLDDHSVLSYLRDTGLIDGSLATSTQLSGGVSNVVLAVQEGRRRLVVKQSLGRLRVRDEWYAPRERVIAEAAALDVAYRLTPTRVPRVLHRDPAQHVIVIEAAPSEWRDWKTQLLRGDITPSVGGHLGSVLGRWHRRTVATELPSELQGASSFEVLRVEPYYRAAARRQPQLSAEIDSLVQEMSGRRLCLVHGDFSPKNVLVDPLAEGLPLWVIDFEVAHRGDPAFDLAFMASHLTLKAIHRPAWARRYEACLRELLKGYVREVEGGDALLEPHTPYVLSHVGALLVARVVGSSPVEYLTGPEQQVALALGAELLREPPPRLEDLFQARQRLAA